MFLPHIKANDAASPKLPFPYPTLYHFGSAAYDNTDVISFLPLLAAPSATEVPRVILACSFAKHMTHIIIFSMQPVPKDKMQVQAPSSL